MRLFTVAHLSQLLRLLAFSAVLIVTATVLAAMLWLTDRFDDDAREKSHLMIESGLNAIVASNETVAHDYAFWTEAFNAVAANDIDWLDANLGSGAYVSATMHVLAIAGGALPDILAWTDEDSAHLNPDDFAAFVDAAHDLVARLDNGTGSAAISTFVDIDSTIWSLAASWIVPHDRDLAAGESPALLVSAVRIDDATAETLGEMFLLTDLGFAATGADLGNLEALSIAGLDGTLGYLTWPAPAPGSNALRSVAIPLALALMLVAAVLGFGTLAVSRLAQRLERALNAAEAADKTKSEFIASLSHELRTPMNGIIGMLELLQLDDLTEEQRELVSVASNSAETQVEMIDHLLAFGQIESGNLHLSNAPFSPDETIREVIALTRNSAQQKDLAVEFRDEGPVANLLLGDRLAIRQIAINLIGNAIKFTNEGKVSVDLQVVPGLSGQRLRLAVSDTGPGIEKADLTRIFDSFVQADSSAKRKFNGIGLGLAISQRLARAMGGNILVQSSPGHGATFVLDVMLEAPGATSATNIKAA